MKFFSQLKKSFPKESEAVLDAFLRNPCCEEEQKLEKKKKIGGI